MAIGQSVMAAPNYRLGDDDKIHILPAQDCVYRSKVIEVKDIVKFDLQVNNFSRFVWHILVCYRHEAESWLFMPSLEETPVMEGELRPGPVKQLKAAL